ncbi:MAG: hypothetical protein IT249_03725 [Chitinophagaceae bacterium]|nr:hypothetical protein [Chitinophagaceae bacterium]
MKTEIIGTVIAKLKQNAKSFTSNLNTLNTNADLDENATIDIDDRSQQDEATDIKNRLQEPLAAMENSIDAVKSFTNTVRKEISQGALAETKDTYFLIGVAVPPMEVNGKKLVGVALDAPAYTTLFGKRKGDSFTLGNKTYKILSVE